MRLGVAAVAASMAWTVPLNAEPGPIGRWLMNEPVTLWDRGMDAMQEEARGLYDLDSDWLPTGMHILGAAVAFNWDDNEINIFAWFPSTPPDYINHGMCNDVRQRVISRITGFPKGITGIKDFDISDVIHNWFSHAGYRSGDRDDELGKKMSRIIFVEVDMNPTTGDGISCRDRITSLDAPSKPLGRDQ